MSWATNGHVRIAWSKEGSGPPLLLIHGLGYARWGWGPLLPRLAARFRVVSFDNRGIGDSDVPPGPYTAAEMATDARAVLDAAEVDRAHVVGSSLGGMIAQELTVAHPDRVDHLVLLSTTPGGDDAYPIPEATMRLIAEAPSKDPETALREFVENALGDPPDPELVDEILALRLAHPQDPAGWQAQAAAGTSFDLGGRLPEISAPTLVIHGTADRVVDHRNADLLADRLPHARLLRLERAGHLCFWERPDEVADAIADHCGDGP